MRGPNSARRRLDLDAQGLRAEGSLQAPRPTIEALAAALVERNYGVGRPPPPPLTSPKPSGYRRMVWSKAPVELTSQKFQPLRLGCTSGLSTLTTSIAARLGELKDLPSKGLVMIVTPSVDGSNSASIRVPL